MILSDAEIQWWLVEELMGISPRPEEDQWQPSSVDLRLGNKFTKYRAADKRVVSTREGVPPDQINTIEADSLILYPGDFVLAHTVERVRIPPSLVAVVDGRSSLGRLGVMVHVTAGYIDPGFEGQITLELFNVGSLGVELFAGDRVCQIRFHKMSSPAKKPYAGKYQGDTGAVASRIERDHRPCSCGNPAAEVTKNGEPICLWCYDNGEDRG